MKLNRKVIISGVGLVAAAVGAAALATMGSGFMPSGIARIQVGELDVKVHKTQATGDWDLHLKSKDNTAVNVDRLSIAAGGFSGWHAHPGPVLATVTLGTIQWYDGSDPVCGWKTLNVGDSFYEPAYNPHNVRNASASAPAEYVAVALAPSAVFAPGGIGFRLDRPKPTNCDS
jgi:quercetin dioxygenase-like cupin family protein